MRITLPNPRQQPQLLVATVKRERDQPLCTSIDPVCFENRGPLLPFLVTTNLAGAVVLGCLEQLMLLDWSTGSNKGIPVEGA